jgi:hypothetical protein
MATNSKAYNKKNYKKYWWKPSQIKKRTEQDKARRMSWLKVWDPREADHIKPLSSWWTTTKSNIRIISRKKNRSLWAKIANRKKWSGYKKSKNIK